MTLLIAAKCHDGILLTADSAKRDGVDGPWSSGALKWLVGERDGHCYAIVFGGEAYITDEMTTLELLTKACRLTGQGLHQHVAESIKQGLDREYAEGPFNSEADRQHYGNTNVVVFLASDGTTLWRLPITRHGCHGICYAQPDMDMFDLPGDQAVRNTLVGMKSSRDTVMEAAGVVGSMFEYACAHLESARFPGAAVWVRPGSVKMVQFNSRAELLARLAQP